MQSHCTMQAARPKAARMFTIAAPGGPGRNIAAVCSPARLGICILPADPRGIGAGCAINYAVCSTCVWGGV